MHTLKLGIGITVFVMPRATDIVAGVGRGVAGTCDRTRSVAFQCRITPRIDNEV